MDSIALVRTVARGIRYRSLPELIGRRVAIHGIETVGTDIRESLGDLLPDECELISPINLPAIAKYGILDLEFTVSESVLTSNCQSGIGLLKETGLVCARKTPPGTKGAGITSEPLTGDTGILEELAEDIAKGQTLCKLFLKAEPARMMPDLEQMSRQARREFFTDLTLPADYFPREFAVIDACLTNTGFVWFVKHFYW
jgi:hypothetical protein